jgi:hypothetical protein
VPGRSSSSTTATMSVAHVSEPAESNWDPSASEAEEELEESTPVGRGKVKMGNVTGVSGNSFQFKIPTCRFCLTVWCKDLGEVVFTNVDLACCLTSLVIFSDRNSIGLPNLFTDP